jgi:hypothetical protein
MRTKYEFHTVKKCRTCGTDFIPHGTRNYYCSLDCVFWSKVTKSTFDACWPWTGAMSKTNGYGVLKWNTKRYKAHQIAWKIYFGAVPVEPNPSYHGICVLHKCDNPSCCNPNHLFIGTQTDNIKDMIIKRRRRSYIGERNPSAVLSRHQVIEIKQLLENKTPTRAIAARYHVGNTTICHIKYGETWKDIH